MRKPHVIPHFTSTRDFENYLPTSPILSSRETSWESVMVRAYHVPSALEETPFPAGPDIYLVLVTSGAVRVDERKLDGPWVTYSIHEGDWFLTQVALEVGFPHQSHFTKTFKRRLGTTPHVYRQGS